MPAPLAPPIPNHIDGRALPAEAFRLAESIDPATETPVRRLHLSEPEEVDRAVAAARRAFEAGWGEAPASERQDALRRLIAAVEARREALAATVSAEIGAPIDFARAHQVDAALGHLRATLAAAEADRPDCPVEPERPADRVRFEPLGVAGLITPWNWPVNQVALKVGAALAAGCTMVLKPSELAAATAGLWAECMDAAGLPPGVFNMVIGDGGTGAALAAHRDVDVLSFTGSTRAGGAVAAAAARRVCPVTLELGGKSPNLVFADCDLETALRQGLAHCFRNAGQSCNAASRMLVERTVYESAVALAAETARATRVGLPSEPGLHLGPQVSAAQFERVQGFIRGAVAEGARLAAGGPGRAEGFERGYFSRPTVFADVTPEMAIFREEVFGPVLAMTPFDSEDEAIALANDTEYGLAAFVQTGDPVRADRVARRLRAGMIQVNGQSRAPGAPFGGVKASGYGREAGIWGIRSFQTVKSISGAERVGDAPV